MSLRRKLTRLCVQEGEGELSRLVGPSGCCELNSTVVSSDTVCVTWVPTTVETLKDTSVLAILTFYRFGGHV